jgi:hypothetical protein
MATYCSAKTKPKTFRFLTLHVKMTVIYGLPHPVRRVNTWHKRCVNPYFFVKKYFNEYTLVFKGEWTGPFNEVICSRKIHIFTHWYFCYKATPMTDDWAHTGVKLYYKGFFVMGSSREFWINIVSLKWFNHTRRSKKPQWFIKLTSIYSLKHV